MCGSNEGTHRSCGVCVFICFCLIPNLLSYFGHTDVYGPALLCMRRDADSPKMLKLPLHSLCLTLQLFLCKIYFLNIPKKKIKKISAHAQLWCATPYIFDDTATYIKTHKLRVEQQQSFYQIQSHKVSSVCLFSPTHMYM